MNNLVHIEDLNVKIVDQAKQNIHPRGLILIGDFPLINANDSKYPQYLETSASGKAFLMDDPQTDKDGRSRSGWIPLSQVTLLRCRQKGFENSFLTFIPFWLAKDKKFI